MKLKIGVFGSGEGSGIVKYTVEAARKIGYQIAKRQAILITGACWGLPHEAALVVAARGGLVLGISPAQNRKEHIEKYCFPFDGFYDFIFTGMGLKGRNVVSLRSCDAAIFIAGRMGTLSEFTIAYDESLEGFVIGILTQSGGLSDEFLNIAEKSGKSSKATIIGCSRPQSLVESVFEQLQKTRR